MAVIELTTANFEQTITENNLVLIDFWAGWCAPCRSFAPIFEATSDKFPEVLFGKVDTEKERELAAHFGIRSIPTLMIFREQILLFSQAGTLSAAVLEDITKKAQELDMDMVRAEIAKQNVRT